MAGVVRFVDPEPLRMLATSSLLASGWLLMAVTNCAAVVPVVEFSSTAISFPKTLTSGPVGTAFLITLIEILLPDSPGLMAVKSSTTCPAVLKSLVAVAFANRPSPPLRVSRIPLSVLGSMAAPSLKLKTSSLGEICLTAPLRSNSPSLS